MLTHSIRHMKKAKAVARVVHGIRNGQIIATGRATSAASVRIFVTQTYWKNIRCIESTSKDDTP